MRADEDPCTEVERLELRSAIGNHHWATSQCRVDKAVDTSRFQKRQNEPTWGDYKALAKSLKYLKATSEIGIRIVKIDNPCVGVWTDSALCGAQGEGLEDPDLEALEDLLTSWCSRRFH